MNSKAPKKNKAFKTTLVNDHQNQPSRISDAHIHFQINIDDIYTILSVLLCVDQNLSENESLHIVRSVMEKINASFPNKGIANQKLRHHLHSYGVSHRFLEGFLSKENLVEHRPQCFTLISEVIEKHFPQFIVSDEDKLNHKAHLEAQNNR